jgi:hypothetical protein
MNYVLKKDAKIQYQSLGVICMAANDTKIYIVNMMFYIKKITSIRIPNLFVAG